MGYEKNQRHEKRDTRKQSPRRNDNNFQFININLSEKDRKAIAELTLLLMKNEQSAWQILAEGGYKVSCRSDSSGLSFMVSITGTENSVNPDLCVTSYASTVDEACVISLYKAHDGKDWIVWEIDDTPKARWG